MGRTIPWKEGKIKVGPILEGWSNRYAPKGRNYWKEGYKVPFSWNLSKKPVIETKMSDQKRINTSVRRTLTPHEFLTKAFLRYAISKRWCLPQELRKWLSETPHWCQLLLWSSNSQLAFHRTVPSWDDIGALTELISVQMSGKCCMPISRVVFV